MNILSPDALQWLTMNGERQAFFSLLWFDSINELCNNMLSLKGVARLKQEYPDEIVKKWVKCYIKNFT